MATPAERIEGDFPRLKDTGYSLQSPIDGRYNCFAFAVGINDKLWGVDTECLWPSDIPKNDHIESAIRALEWFGYERCANGFYETGFERVAVYALEAEECWEHVARQMPGGRGWVSKLGVWEDILHDTPEALESESYGTVVAFLRKAIEGPF